MILHWCQCAWRTHFAHFWENMWPALSKWGKSRTGSFSVRGQKPSWKSNPVRIFFIAENESMISFLSYVWISAENIMIKIDLQISDLKSQFQDMKLKITSDRPSGHIRSGMSSLLGAFDWSSYRFMNIDDACALEQVRCGAQ